MLLQFIPPEDWSEERKQALHACNAIMGWLAVLRMRPQQVVVIPLPSEQTDSKTGEEA